MNSGATQHFAWDTSGGLPLLLTDGSTNYLYDDDGLPLEQIDASGNVLYYQHDQLGSTRLLTNSNGSVVATYAYDPYGNVTGRTGASDTPLRWAGQYEDPDTGLYDLRSRYYDPLTGQFINRDVLAAITHVPYRYAENDPLNETDPLGLYPGEHFVHKAEHLGKDVAVGAVDVVAVVPYAVYYTSYQTSRGVRAAGRKLGGVGSALADQATAGLVIPQIVGLGADAGIDAFKNAVFGDESICDEGKRGYINPLHRFLPGPLKGPQLYLPGIHPDGKIDIEG